MLLIIVYIIPCSSIEQKYALWSLFICPVWLVSFYMEHMISQNRLDLDKWPCLWIRTAQFCSGQKFELREIWRVVAEKIVHRCIEPFHLNLQEPVVFGWPDWMNKKGPWSRKTPGAPLTNFNVGGGGVQQRFKFYTQKNHNFRICLPKEITTFF